MTPSARLAAAIEALGAISVEAAPPADRVLDRYFRDRRYIGSKDRQAIAERVFGVLRRRARLDWHLRESGFRDVVDARRRVLADVIVADGRSMDAIEMLFSAGPHATGKLTDRELALAEHLTGRALDAPEAPPECPYWLAERLRALYGERFAEEMSALNRTAPFDLRVNLLKAKDRTEAEAALKAEGIEAEPTTLSPLGLRLAQRKPIEHWTAFRSGLIEVQDEGSQIVALLVDARPGMKVADYCAGAGGKTLALAASMGNEGRIVACDPSEGRLDRARVRLRRAGVHNVEMHLLAPGDKWVKRQAGTFERVLVDAPCSGSGTWRRNPDARWRYGPEDIDRLIAEQRQILDRAAKLVKPLGRLIYATCALLKEENEDQIAAFLERNPGFASMSVAGLWPLAVGGDPPGAEPMLRLSPARHGTDGFFVAVLERRT
ncbi:MAG: RsmB/NOP family class I SAM-dependent RNA methyltransferase [Alphaproteobacteria bacterium]|nr:RsmB/NOP family class I SAM-dependent RNA methyltransferase [Alphaproteobacteria bacterium]